MIKGKLKLSIALLSVCTLSYGQNNIKLTDTQTDITISKHIYGHFAEHLGRCIYDGFYVGEANDSIAHTACGPYDVVAALRKLHIPILGWPGGCCAGTYHW